MQVWFITGASRGFGLELTRQALEAGDAVLAAARRPETVVQGLGDSADAVRSRRQPTISPSLQTPAIFASAEHPFRLLTALPGPLPDQDRCFRRPEYQRSSPTDHCRVGDEDGMNGS